jgi:hypothetical protein
MVSKNTYYFKNMKTCYYCTYLCGSNHLYLTHLPFPVYPSLRQDTQIENNTANVVGLCE